MATSDAETSRPRAVGGIRAEVVLLGRLALHPRACTTPSTSGLDRLATSEVDLARELYRHPGMLKAISGAVALPDQAQRVAISLSDPQLGPFIVVTRDGHFVTCLGRGMKPGEHPVVTRGQLDGLSSKFGTLRECMALATKLVVSKESACERLLRRVVVSADTVSREDFLAVSAWEPMLAPVFMTM